MQEVLLGVEYNSIKNQKHNLIRKDIIFFFFILPVHVYKLFNG